MKAFVIDQYADVVKGRMTEIAGPQMGPNDVIIAIEAASCNPVDFKIAQGALRHAIHPHFPLILGQDGAGTVASVGERVTRVKKGDAVFFRCDHHRFGTFAERVAVHEEHVAPVPKGLSYVEAAALPLVCLTAYQALFELGKVGSGTRVFIPAGSGGVGCHAIQMAKLKGAYVATTTSTKNVRWLKSLGTDEVYDYTTTDFSAFVSHFDVVLDTLGGEVQDKCFGVLKDGGLLISIVGPPTAALADRWDLGGLSRWALRFMSIPVLFRARRAGVRYEFLGMRPSGSQLEEICRWVEGGKLKAIVDHTWPLEKTQDALDYLAKGHACGKVVVTIN
jgi:NADPH:quinone reductase-like Zn-dependent oxidoreductase